MEAYAIMSLHGPDCNVCRLTCKLVCTSLQIFDAGSRTLLRQLKAHKRAAHVAHFAPDRMHVLSAADDTTVSPSAA